jgi:hypothetical protein
MLPLGKVHCTKKKRKQKTITFREVYKKERGESFVTTYL